MNIAIVTHYFLPHVGGIELVAEAHAKGLALRDHDVTIVTTDIDANQTTETRNGFQIVRYAAFNPFEEQGVPYPVPNPIDCYRTIRSIDVDFDIIHVHGLNYLTSLLPLLTIEPRETPVVLHHHTPFVDYSPALNLLQKTNDRIIGRSVMRYADTCLAAGVGVSEYVAGLTGKPAQVFYNGVDTDRFNSSVVQTQNEFLYVGRLTQKKGVDKLLRIIDNLDDRGYDGTVRIVGSGEMAERIDEVANSQDNVIFEGFVTPERLPEVYSRARALFVPQQQGDAFPTLTMLEALASGTPLVLSRATASAPGFTEGKTHIQVRPTADAFAEAIHRLSDDEASLQQMSRTARQVTVDRYEWSVRIDRLEEIYEEMAA